MVFMLKCDRDNCFDISLRLDALGLLLAQVIVLIFVTTAQSVKPCFKNGTLQQFIITVILVLFLLLGHLISNVKGCRD